MNKMTDIGYVATPTHSPNEFLAYETECRSALKPLLMGLLDMAVSAGWVHSSLDANVPGRAAGVSGIGNIQERVRFLRYPRWNRSPRRAGLNILLIFNMLLSRYGPGWGADRGPDRCRNTWIINSNVPIAGRSGFAFPPTPTSPPKSNAMTVANRWVPGRVAGRFCKQGGHDGVFGLSKGRIKRTE